jgi:hypothetical protein
MGTAEPQIMCRWEIPTLKSGVTHVLSAEPGKV